MLMNVFVAKAYDFEMNGIYYNIHGQNAIVTYAGVISWNQGGSYSGDIASPKSVTYNGTTYTVTAIGKYAFWICPGLTSVTLPNTITTIEDCSFSASQNLTSIDIPNSVISIGKQAFDNCTGLSNVYLGNSVTTIDAMAFQNCSSITSFTIPNSVNYIGERAFQGCIGLTSITIPYSVDSIGNYAFTYCSGLTSIIVADGNPNYDSRNNCNALIETATNTLLAGCMNTTIPNTITGIGELAFWYCTELTRIVIPNSVTNIGDNAFEMCSGLTSIVIPNSVTSIGIGAFAKCKSLASIIIPHSVINIGNSAFSRCSGLTEVTIGYSVTGIGNSAFANCSALTSVTCFATTPPGIGNEETFPSSVTDQATLYVPVRSVEAYQRHNYWGAFYQIVGTNIIDDFEVNGIYYHALTDKMAIVIQRPDGDSYYCGDIVIPDSISYQDMQFAVVGIDDGAFEDCYELTSVVIGDAVETIGEEAFQGCTGLTSVTIGSNVTSIGAKAFNYCNALQTVTCRGIVPPVMANSNCFSSASYNHATLVVPRKAFETYQATDYWYRFAYVECWGSAGPGDVDGNGNINVKDVSILISYLLGNNVDGFDEEYADLNGNGRVDIGDVSALINILLSSK